MVIIWTLSLSHSHRTTLSSDSSTPSHSVGVLPSSPYSVTHTLLPSFVPTTSTFYKQRREREREKGLLDRDIRYTPFSFLLSSHSAIFIWFCVYSEQRQVSEGIIHIHLRSENVWSLGDSCFRSMASESVHASRASELEISCKFILIPIIRFFGYCSHVYSLRTEFSC